MARLFALDQNFPLPILRAVGTWLERDAELVSIGEIDRRLTDVEDWQILHALHADERPWDGLITTDSGMLAQARELAVLCQTRLTLVVADAAGHDPVKATGLVLAHLSGICERTAPDRAQLWRLRTSPRPPDDPWAYLRRVADRRGEPAADLYAGERLDDITLRKPPLA